MLHSIFALELCVRMDWGDPLRLALARTLEESVRGDPPPRLSLHAKWEQYRRLASLLLEAQGQWERGCWDYFDDDARALKDFEMWSQGMITEEGPRREPSAAVDPYRGGEGRFLTLTMALLLVQGSPADRMLNDLCRIPDSVMWRRESFAKLLRGLSSVSFASVKGDVVYLIPRDEGWGLTAADLDHPKFEYLRPLT